MFLMRRRIFLAGCLSLLLAGPVLATPAITVFAAASLTNALDAIAARYQQEQAVNIVTSYASSSTLARQLAQGAPADVFISADQQWMDYAVSKQSVDPRSRTTLLGNTLVLIAPEAANPQPVPLTAQTPWRRLLADGRLAVGDPDHVPAGIYAKQALQSLGAWTTLAPRLARASSVRAALALVERREAPYGIVYGSDAVASQKVRVVGTFPPETHPPVEYPMAKVSGRDNAVVDRFYHYLAGPQAAAIFQQYGFTTRQ
ncbi:molybdate ABC transporter substrate-binding protein [Pantoea sp. 1.19]|uniref:molybdate ABC transporter substrate-binding protein n=1 Tax=Pantoea sp. 1.19 TaxID=1925589 RepID=UPI000948C4AF|nr:molybdate ABC transporter substrate-binding protein [Pantoea sp. 1.19]